jgi:hypothetical protein
MLIFGGMYFRFVWRSFARLSFDRVINVQHVFAQVMVHQENPSIIITTGSKQGITNPPYAIIRLLFTL